MSTCAKIGYSFEGERPSGYRSSLCDPCEDGSGCCNWISFPGFHCPTGCLCCPHPTGAIMWANITADWATGIDDNQTGPYYFVDKAENKLSGYSPIQPPGGGTASTPTQIDLGLISLVDDMGVEYMHELQLGGGLHNYGGSYTHGFTLGNVFRLLISSQMDQNADMCTTTNAYGAPCSGAVSVAYWHSGFVAEMTPTPVWTRVVGDPSSVNWWTYWATQTNSASIFTTSTAYTRAPGDPTWTDTNTPIINPYRTMTDTAAGQTAGLGYHGHMTSTPAGQTDTSIPGVVQESYAPTPTPSYIDIRDTEASGYNQFNTYVETSSTNWVDLLVIENTPVTGSPAELIPFVSGAEDCQDTSLGTGVSGSVVQGGSWYGNTDNYYEPLVGAKIVPVAPLTSAMSMPSFIFCTNGTDFKRLGTGSKTIGHTQGEPFSLFAANAGQGEFSGMKAPWPYTFIPSRQDCWDIAADKYSPEWSNGELYARTGSDGWTNYDLGLSQNPLHTAHRLEIIESKMWPTGDGGQGLFADARQVIKHPKEYSVAAMEAGAFGFADYHNWHGCASYNYDVPSGGMEDNMVTTGQVLLGRAYSQKSFLDSVNNWVEDKLGAGWRIARANEIIKDYIPPRKSCRTFHTHEDGSTLSINTGGYHSWDWDGTALGPDSRSNPNYNYHNWYYEGCGNCRMEVPVLDEAGNTQTTEFQTLGAGDPLFGNTTTELWHEPYAGSLTTYNKATSSGFTEGPEGTQTPTPAGATESGVGTTFGATPIWGEKLTTTADYGTEGTFNPVGVTETLAVVDSMPTPVPAIGTSTYDLIFQTITGQAGGTRTTYDVKVNVLTNLGNDIGAYATRRWSDWCVSRRGCEASPATPLGFFGPSGSLGDACKTCNESAYADTVMSMCDNLGETWSYEMGYWGEADRWSCRAHGPDEFNYRLALGGLVAMGGTPPTFVASKETAVSLGLLWNMFHYDLVKGAASFLEPGYGCGGNAANYQWGYTGQGDINPDHPLIDITSWTNNPEAFYHTTKSNYDKSRCCDGGKPTKESWCGIPCFNLKSGNYCYSGEEININLGTGTGTFIGVVAGGAYWDDVIQTGVSDEEVSGDANTQYSLGYGLLYPSGDTAGALSGQTDNGDSRYLRHHTKTYTGSTGESGYATFIYAVKVYEGTQIAGGSALVTCPGKTGDTDCYTNSVPFLRDGESSEAENVVWGSGGKTYIKGLVSPSGGCPGECETRIGIKICYGKLEGTSYSGFADIGTACTIKCESGHFTGWFIHNPSSKRGYTETGEYKIPKNDATVYSGEKTSETIKTEGSGFYYVESGKYIQISPEGKVTGVGDCTSNIGEELEFIANGHSFPLGSEQFEAGNYGSWTEFAHACAYPSTSTFSAGMIFTGNGEEVSIEHESCSDFYMPAVGTKVKVKDSSATKWPDGSPASGPEIKDSFWYLYTAGSYYYGVACTEEPTMAGYYAKIDFSSSFGEVENPWGYTLERGSITGEVVETGKCETVLPFYPVNISYPDWSDVDGVVGWPSSGTLCNLGYLESSHSEYGTYSELIHVVGYCTGVLTLESSANAPLVTGSSNVIRKTPTVDGEPLFGEEGLGLWYECGTDGTGSAQWGSAMFRVSANGAFANKSGQCSN
jgi:hypothetical protein